MPKTKLHKRFEEKPKAILSILLIAISGVFALSHLSHHPHRICEEYEIQECFPDA